MATNTGNENFNGIRFTAAKHQMKSPFNKSLVSVNTSPVAAGTTAAGTDPLPWAANSLHGFYTDSSATTPANPLSLAPGTRLFQYSFFGQITTAGAGNVSLGLSATPGGAISQLITTIAVGAGDVSFSETGGAMIGPLATTMYPVYSFDVMVSAVTVAPQATFEFFQM